MSFPDVTGICEAHYTTTSSLTLFKTRCPSVRCLQFRISWPEVFTRVVDVASDEAQFDSVLTRNRSLKRPTSLVWTTEKSMMI